MSSLANLTLSLLAVLALILAIGWAMKRFKLAGPRGRGDIAVLDELALGPRERIVLVRVGDSQVLLGVTAAGIVGLQPLCAPIALSAAPPATPFSDRLREFMNRSGPAQ
jgi:flagellar protein FliO/FliZ